VRILIHRLGPGLGDIVRCLPALEAARRRWPTAEITFATAAAYGPLFDENPDVNRVTAPAGRLGRRAHRLLARAYDGVIDLHGPAAAIERRLLSRSRRRGAARPMRSRQEIFCHLVGAEPRHWIGHYRARPAERVWADDAVARVALHPCPPLGKGGASGAGPQPALSLEGRGSRVPTVAVQRHAANPLRDWPWVDDLAEALRTAGCRVVLLERRMGMTVRQLAALVAACDLLIAPDSGPLHLAALVGTPCLGLFGPTAPDVICKHYPRHRWLSGIGRAGACDRPCNGRPRATCHRATGRKPCLAAIGVDEVLREALRFLHTHDAPDAPDAPRPAEEVLWAVPPLSARRRNDAHVD